MQHYDPSKFQPADFNVDKHDDATLAALIDEAKPSIAAITAKTMTISLPSGETKKVSPLEFAQMNKDQAQLDNYYQQAEKLFRRADGTLDMIYVDDAKHGRTILFWAIATFQSAACITALKKGNPHFAQEVYRDNINETYFPIFYAISIDNHEAVAALLKNNNELIAQESEYGRTPTHYAAELHRFKILEIMFACNNKIARFRTAPQLTPLHFVIATEDADNAALKWLLEHDQHTDEETRLCDIGDNFGITPLHLAVTLNRVSAVKLLLENGADYTLTTGPDAQPPNSTPLQIAAANGNNDIVRLLLLCGARPESVPRHGTPTHPIDTSRLNKRLQIVFELLNYRVNRCNEPNLKNSFFGITAVTLPIIGEVTVTWSRQQKRVAVDELVRRILNDPTDEHDPFENMHPSHSGPLVQGEVTDIVKPLLDEHKTKIKNKLSPSVTPHRTPSPTGSSSE